MPESNLCLNAQGSLEEIQVLRREFDRFYDEAALSNHQSSINRTREIKTALSEKVRSLKKLTWLAEVERTHRFREQYDVQVALLKRLGFVETKIEHSLYGEDYEVVYIKGIDNKKHPLPSYKEIIKHIAEQNDLLRMKTDQGFTKLVLVPFAMGLDKLVAKFREYLLQYKENNDRFRLEVDEPIRTLKDAIERADRQGTIVYDPQMLIKRGHEGETKTQILMRQHQSHAWNRGWRILLLQADEKTNGIERISPDYFEPPASSEKILRGNREALPLKKSPQEYLQHILQTKDDPSSPYRGESGMTLEEWIMAFMVHLEKTGETLDAMLEHSSTVTVLSGAYFNLAGNVAGAYWYPDKGYAGLIGLSYVGAAQGCRTAVRI